MLGDGHLAPGGRNARLMIGRAEKDKDYLEFERNIFHNFLTPANKDEISLNNDRCCFSTIASPTFTPYRLKWYPNGKKIVPLDLELSSVSIAHWIADDGHVSYNKLPYRFTLELSTHGFSQTEVIFLSNLLKNKYDEDFIVGPKNKKKTYYVIKAYDSACRAVFKDIDCYFKMYRKRIWNKPESRFYNDPPGRQRSMLKDFKIKQEKLFNLIESGVPITLINLANELGYIYNGKPEYKAMNKLLKQYLESGKIIKEVDKFNNNTTTVRILK